MGRINVVPDTSPAPSISERKAKDRADIERQTAEYLSSGKHVQLVGSELNRCPVYLTNTTLRPNK